MTIEFRVTHIEVTPVTDKQKQWLSDNCAHVDGNHYLLEGELESVMGGAQVTSHDSYIVESLHPDDISKEELMELIGISTGKQGLPVAKLGEEVTQYPVAYLVQGDYCYVSEEMNKVLNTLAIRFAAVAGYEPNRDKTVDLSKSENPYLQGFYMMALEALYFQQSAQVFDE